MLSDPSRRGRTFLRTLLILSPLMMLMCTGCDTLGVVASKVTGITDIAPAYKGLKGQRVAIMVWADEGLTMDHPRLIADVSTSLQGKLQQGIDADVNELKDTTFLDAGRVLRFQEAHPEYQSDSAEQVALRLPPATRLIYVEVQSFSLHPNDSVDLSRGQAVANVKVIEVTDGKSKVAYQAENVTGIYPQNAPPEGMPNLDDGEVYRKSVDALTTELGKLFITHPADDDHDESDMHAQ